MPGNNKEKSKQLGMPFGTANNRLRKKIMFYLAQKCGMDKCHRCGQQIEDVTQFSIEHKVPWLHSDNPGDLFFGMENISFSHLSCNCACQTNYSPTQCPSTRRYQQGCRCEGCTALNTKSQREYRRRRRQREST